MAKALTNAREGVSATAPKMLMMKIPTDKIREVIGSGGKVIREICDTTGAKIDIEDDGSVKIAAVEQSALDAAYNWIRSIVAATEIGEIYDGQVGTVREFGAFVNFLGPTDGQMGRG